MKKTFSCFTVGCLELILLVGSCAATPKTEQLAQQRQVTPSVQNYTTPSAQTELKLRGIPLACYVRVGPLGFLPSSVSSSFSMLANEQSTELAEIALAYAQAKQFSSAIATTKKMDDNLIQAVTLVDIAGMYAEKGQYTQAKQLVNSIQGYDTFKSQLLARIASKYALSGKPQQASQTFMQALRLAKTLDAKLMRDGAIADIAIEYAAAGQYKQALQLTKTIKDESEKPKALAGIVTQYALAGQFDQALNLAKTIGDDYYKSKALESMANSATVNQLAQLTQVTQTIKDDTYKVVSLAKIASRYVAVGNFDQAVKVTQMVNAINPDGDLLPDIITEYTTAGKFDQALQLANSMKNEYWQGQAMVKIAGKYAAAGLFDEAVKFADTINSGENKTQALKAIASEYAKTGQYDRALALVGTIPPAANTTYEAIQAQFIPLLKCAQAQ
ncbi:MAG: hypothetical protein WBB28_25955 [Crinalium sp.]